MMLKRPDAFTLVELLAVIIILGIILVLAVPRVSDMINKYRDKAYERQLDLILKAAEQYSVLYEDEIEWDVNQAYIYLEDLQNKDLIASPLKNPKGGDLEGNKVKITLTKLPNGVIDYEIEDLDSPLSITLASKIIANEEYVERKYKDTIHEAYFYVGANPNNWIEFGTIDGNPILWQIIKSNDEGIKIIYHDGDGNIGNYLWHGLNNSWETSFLKDYLDDWYDAFITNNPNQEDYVAPIQWCIGASAGTALLTFLADECTQTTSDFTGIGLIRASDYISTSGHTDCTGSGKTDCKHDNFLFTEYFYWTQTARAATSNLVWGVSSIGYLTNSNVSSGRGVRPVLNLNSDILYDSGNGTSSSPYKIK